jgi:cobalt-zinc-cadmium efflux system membrane fusion protein
VREVDAPAIRRGMPLEVRVLAYPERVFKAKLAYVAPSVDPTTRRVAVRAEVENPDGALKPEMFASFSIVTGTDSKAPALPESAIIYEGRSTRIWIARDNGSLALRQVKLGRSSSGVFEVLAGVSAGEKVVTSGALFIDRAASQE